MKRETDEGNKVSITTPRQRDGLFCNSFYQLIRYRIMFVLAAEV